MVNVKSETVLEGKELVSTVKADLNAALAGNSMFHWSD